MDLNSEQNRKNLSQFDKGGVWALHKHAHWPLQRIATAIGCSKSTISRIINRIEREPKTPVRQGRPRVITTRKRQRLVNRLTTDAQSRRLSLQQLARLEGLTHDLKTIRKALDLEGYRRYAATKKPFLTQAQKDARLQWALEHVEWSDRQWSRVLWTDEASIRCGYFGQIYVTRKASEAFNDDCLIARFRKYSACMIWGCINAEGINELVIFDKGSIDGDIYRTAVVPEIQKVAIRQQATSIFQQQAIIMQDNASIHTAKATLSLLHNKNLILMDWPANSPDLNPIENIWSLLKHRVGLHFPQTRAEVEAAIRHEWQQISTADIAKCCQSMRQRCQAVIAAQGGHTKW